MKLMGNDFNRLALFYYLLFSKLLWSIYNVGGQEVSAT